MKFHSQSSEYYTGSDKNESFEIKKFFLKYIKYWPYFLISTVFFLGLAHLANKFIHPEYKVQSKFLIKEDSPHQNILDLTGIPTSRISGQEQKLVNESVILKSVPIIEETIKRLDFDVEYYKKGTFHIYEIYNLKPVEAVVDWNHSQLVGGAIKLTWSGDEFYVDYEEEEYQLYTPESTLNEQLVVPPPSGQKYKFGKWVVLPFAKFKVENLGREQTGEIYLKFVSKSSLINSYTGEDFQIWPLDQVGSSILGLSLITKQPEKGATFLNTLMEVYLDIELEEKNNLAKLTVDFIDTQVADVADSLNFIEDNLENYKSNNKTYNISAEGSTMYNELSALENTLSQEKYKQDYYEHLENYLIREDYKEILIPSGMGIDDPILNTLLQDLILLQAEKSRLLSTETNVHPAVIEVSRKIGDLNTSIQEVLRNVKQNVIFSISDLERRVDRIKAAFSKLPATEQNLMRIQRKFVFNENIYTYLLQRRAESAISMASNTSSNKIIEYASPVYQPIKLKYITNYVFGFTAGMALPVLVLIGMSLYNVRITEIRETEEELSATTLSTIGRNLGKQSLIVLKESKASITEAFRTLRTNLYFVAPKDKQITIAVTSSIAGEGKSFCGINLAAAYSLNGRKTLLIDCDLYKPKNLAEFNLGHNDGLSTYLSKQHGSIDSLIQKSEYENLYILKGGPTPPNPGELLLNRQFEPMLQDLKNSYDVIILDTPPVGLIGASRGIIKLADIILYVIRYNFSYKSSIEDINKLKKQMELDNLYVIFNDVDGEKLNYGGYGYGYYTEDKKKPSFLNRLFKSGRRHAAM